MYYKLSDYAKKFNVTYRTAWNRYKAGKIENCFIDKTGHVCINVPELVTSKRAAIYSRVLSLDEKDRLERQAERNVNYTISNGFNIQYNIKEIGSGLDDQRPKLIKLLQQNDWDVLIVENKDRLTRFGFNYLETLLLNNNKRIIVINHVDDDKTDLIQDLVSIIYSFSARMYGLRKKKNKEDIIKFLED